LLNVYLLENDVALISLYQWGNMLCQTEDFVCKGKKELSGGNFFFSKQKKKKRQKYFNHFCL